MASLDVVYKDYDELVKMLETDQNKDDVYQAIMKKEENVLQVMNRIADERRENNSRATVIYNLSLLEFSTNFLTIWKNIITEFLYPGAYLRWQEILMQEDRKIYVGAMLVLIAFVLFFIDIST